MAKTDIKHPSDFKEVVLSGNLSLGFAGEVRERLLQELAGSESVRVVLKDVAALDLSLVQILCATHRSALKAGKELVLVDQLPEEFVRLIEDAGLQGHIGCSSQGRKSCLWQRH